MTDPTSYAAGIEAAARVADTASRLWGSDSKVAEALSALAEDIRSLAPERGARVSLQTTGELCDLPAPAPPAATSGWRDQAQAILKRAWVCAHQLPGKDGEGEILLRLKSSADAYAVLDLLTAIWRDAAPPPPVPVQAESKAFTCTEAANAYREPIARLNDENDRLALRIRELEGEVARLKGDCDAYSRTMKVIATLPPTDRDRLTTAAQAARDALDQIANWSTDSQTRPVASAALASLASVLDEKPS